MKHNNVRQVLFPILAALIWGTAFVAQDLCADVIDTFSFNAARSYIAVVVLLVIIFIFMLTLSPKLTLIVFATVIPLMICIFTLRYTIRKLFTINIAKNSRREEKSPPRPACGWFLLRYGAGCGLQLPAGGYRRRYGGR